MVQVALLSRGGATATATGQEAACSATSSSPPVVRAPPSACHCALGTWTCRYRLYFIAAPLALSMSCRPLTRKSQGPSPSPVLSSAYAAKDTLLYATRIRRVCPLCRDNSNLADRSSLQHVPSTQFDVACSSRERLLCIPHTRPPPAAPVAPSSPGQGSPGTVFCTGAQTRRDEPSASAGLKHPDQLGRAFLIPQRTSPETRPLPASLVVRRCCHQNASLQSQGLQAPGFAQRQPAKQLQWLVALPWTHAKRIPAHELPRRASAQGARSNPRPCRLLAQHLCRARALQTGAGKGQEEPAQALHRRHVQV